MPGRVTTPAGFSPRLMAGVGVLVSMLLVTEVAGQEIATVPPPQPLKVSEIDRLAWERYQYMRELAVQQLENLRLRHAESLRLEHVKLAERFARNYGVALERLSVSEGVFTLTPEPLGAR